MMGDSCARGLAQVHAEVVALRVISFLQRRLRALRQSHHFSRSFGITSSEIGGVHEGNHHYVAGSIRIAIEDNEVLTSAENDQGLGVVLRGQSRAKNAAFVLLGIRDVAIPPGGPQIIHRGRSPLSSDYRAGCRRARQRSRPPCADYSHNPSIPCWA